MTKKSKKSSTPKFKVGDAVRTKCGYVTKIKAINKNPYEKYPYALEYEMDWECSEDYLRKPSKLEKALK